VVVVMVVVFMVVVVVDVVDIIVTAKFREYQSINSNTNIGRHTHTHTHTHKQKHGDFICLFSFFKAESWLMKIDYTVSYIHDLQLQNYDTA
jgi:hypothetical protein